MKKGAVIFVAIGLVGLIGGCGGGGGPNVPRRNTGEVSGRLNGVANPTEYTITVDGQPVAARPNASGQFNIHGLPPGTHTIGFVGPGGMQGAYRAVVVRRGQTTSVGDVEPTLGGQIAGIVTKVLPSGEIEPVAGVEVTATSAKNWIDPAPGNDEPIEVGRTGDPDQVVIVAHTNKNGSYLMEAVPPGGYDIACVVPGYEPVLLWVWVDAGSTAVADIRVYPAPEQGVGTVEGTVTGEGTPLEGALVTLTTGNPWPLPLTTELMEQWLGARRERAAGWPCRDGACTPPWIEVRSFSTLTDAQGHYSLNVPVGKHFIECWLDGWEWQGKEVAVARNQTTEVNFDLVKLNDGREPSEPPHILSD